MKPPLSLAAAAAFAALTAATTHAETTVWNFSDSGNRFGATSGSAVLDYWDPAATGWGPLATQFGSASGFGLPAMQGGDAQVMAFPACENLQGYSFTHTAAPNGVYADSGLVSNYTLVMDVLYPAASDGAYRALIQTDTGNGSDAELFLLNAPSGGMGINGNYRGRVTPDTWHRLAWVVRAAPGEGQAHRFIDGQFVGAVGTTGSGLEDRFALQSMALLFTDNDGETRPGYVSSISFTDRALSPAEVAALGGPNAGGVNVPGPAAPPYAQKMARRVGAIGHRGGAFGWAPDNTLAALNLAFAQGAAGVEVDVRMTGDGKVVCFHDSTVDRTTDGFGDLSSYTLAQLKALDAGSWYDATFAGERVPTLEEALTAAKGKGIVYLDIKEGGLADGFAEAVQATGFPLGDLWFWTPGNETYAAEIRAAIPGAQIFWGSPDAAWQTDPNYFQHLRDIGVSGFSIGTGTGTPDLAFAARAKAEGFIVEVYTILDPDTMLRAAEAGVDYMETDFPDVMAALQPAQVAKASGPIPANGATDIGQTVLRWVSGTDATAHRIHFGTTNPPPFVAEQTSDLFATPALAPGATYFWRIDEVTPGGTVAGDVWHFDSPPPAADGAISEFHFSLVNEGIAPVLGTSVLEYASFDSEALVSYAVSDGVSVPHMDGQPVTYARIPGYTTSADGLNLTLTDVAPNGGGSYINDYTLVFDLYVPSSGGSWFAFFNTDPNNANDSDFFLRNDGAIGISALGYSGGGAFTTDAWHRVIFSANLDAGEVLMFIDGALVRQRTGGALTDGRFALYSNAQAGHDLRLFGDEDGETREALVSAVAFVDRPLSAAEAAALGGPKAGGIFTTGGGDIPPPTVSVSGGSITVNWVPAPGRWLQRSTNLTLWQDVGGTTGGDDHSEPLTGGPVFFRVAE